VLAAVLAVCGSDTLKAADLPGGVLLIQVCIFALAACLWAWMTFKIHPPTLFEEVIIYGIVWPDSVS
jgi:hypothetical protein